MVRVGSGVVGGESDYLNQRLITGTIIRTGESHKKCDLILII